VFSLRYGLNSYILFRRASTSKGYVDRWKRKGLVQLLWVLVNAAACARNISIAGRVTCFLQFLAVNCVDFVRSLLGSASCDFKREKPEF
jgi:hypothetical protein